jgi:hypothetical protein
MMIELRRSRTATEYRVRLKIHTRELLSMRAAADRCAIPAKKPAIACLV